LAAGAPLAAHIADLQESGVRVWSAGGSTFWAASRDHVAGRLPVFSVAAPDRSEVDQALENTGAFIASYLQEPDAEHPANAWLYVCADQAYSLETRPPAMRRNIRRALRQLAIRPLTANELLAHGSKAFCDTRWRSGLDDGTLSGFRRYFNGAAHGDRTGWTYLGAWKDDELAAFVTARHVEDWVELGCFSMDSMLGFRPNDALLYVALSHFLNERQCRVVTFGLSSIQANSNAAGLHRFKLKVGFDARPVHRAFVLHPLVRPFANRATLSAAHWAVNSVLRRRPRHGRLKRFAGMLACMLGATWMMRAATPRYESVVASRQRVPSESICPT
jgi:hypothetical protein